MKIIKNPDQELTKMNEEIVPEFNKQHNQIKNVFNRVPKRTKYTKNEIRVYESGVCEIDVYDIYGKYKETGIFSECDLPIVSKYKWYSDSVGYLSTTIEGKKCRLHKLLFPDVLVDHYDNDKLNNTRENLQPITHAVNIAKITGKVNNPHGVTGIYFTRNNTWEASIVVNKEKMTKNFKDKNDAILMRYIWELNNWGKNAPQLIKITHEYPRLVEAMQKGVKINNNVTIVKTILDRLSTDDHCPCSLEKTPDTKCMCKEFREQTEGMCHCGLFIKVVE